MPPYSPTMPLAAHAAKKRAAAARHDQKAAELRAEAVKLEAELERRRSGAEVAAETP